MAESLKSLCFSGRNLKLIDQSEIHYPQSGASRLATVEMNHFWFTARRAVVVSLLKRSGVATRSATILGLDIGCGTGFTAVYLTENGFPTLGIDSYASFAELYQQGRGAGFIQGNIHSIDPEREFNFVLLLDVLEHVVDDAGFLKQAIKFVKPDGVVILSLPAFRFLWSGVDEQAGHLRRYDKETMTRLVEGIGQGVRIEKQFYYYGSTIVPYWFSRLRRKGSEKIIQTERHPSKFMNSLIKGVLEVERMFIPFSGLPIGSSLFTIIRVGKL